MSDATTDSALVSEPELEEVTSYRSLSSLAVTTLVLGCLSPLALVHIVLWLVPAMTLVSGWIALRQMRLSEAGGVRVARCGITIAVLFGTWAVSQAAFGDYAHKIKTRKFADAWIQLLQNGQLRHAHQWNLSPSGRVRDPSLVDAYYEGNVEGQTALRKFLAKGCLPQLCALKPNASIHFKHWDEWVSSGDQRRGKLRYEWIGAEGKPEEFVITVVRETESETRLARWQVVSVEPPPSEVRSP